MDPMGYKSHEIITVISREVRSTMFNQQFAKHAGFGLVKFPTDSGEFWCHKLYHVIMLYPIISYYTPMIFQVVLVKSR